MTRNLTLFGIVLIILLALVGVARAYDATYNFDQQMPELVSGWNAYAGPTKGGPYPVKKDCKKPTTKTDGTFDCTVTGLTYNPVYGVVANYGGDGKEIATSTEGTLSISVPAPSALKILVTIKTVSSVDRKGKVSASTTVAKRELTDDESVKEGTTGYRNTRGEWVTITKLVMGGT